MTRALRGRNGALSGMGPPYMRPFMLWLGGVRKNRKMHRRG